MHHVDLRSQLRKSIRGEITWDDEILDCYSVDSSFYQKRPKLVAFPKDASDVIKILEISKKYGTSVTPRGGATGLVGSALNDGIILDMKNFDKIAISQDWVSVGSGVRKGQLDKALNRKKKFLGPNPSVGPYCTVGGMIATNASGSRSLKYGSIIDNLLEVTIVTGGGKIVKRPSRTKLARSIEKIAESLDSEEFPHVSKNSCGYRLDAISTNNVQKILAASEGTLGIILSAKLRIFKTPQRRVLVVLGYDSVKNAAVDCQNLVRLKPSALELVDKATMRNFHNRFPKKTGCLLFVEFDSNIRASMSEIKKTSTGKRLYTLYDAGSILRWWAYRNAALHFSLKSLAGQISPHIIEDATVPLEKVHDLVAKAQSLAKLFGARLVMYGHVGNGNIHVRVALPRNNKKTIDRMAREFFAYVIGLGGTITGEHGDGMTRTKYVRMQYGKKTYEKFKKVKKQFDPSYVLNPGKIITR
jgi:FAD/FMN-containing dehydrogenase